MPMIDVMNKRTRIALGLSIAAAFAASNAEAVFKGDLKQATEYRIEIDNSASTGKAGVTIMKMSRRGKIASARAVTVEAGGSLAIIDTLAPGIVRVIVSVDPSPGSAVPIRVVQDGTAFAEPCETAGFNSGDCKLVFDAVP